jgi:hypothetical protein
MTGMTLIMDEAAVSQIITKAILEGLGTEQRDQILAQAVAFLTTPTKDNYGRAGKTPLQNAFDMALSGCATKVAREVLESNGGVLTDT